MTNATNRHTDPTYLRFIYDGLLSNTIHKDNFAGLTDGLVAMYEESLLPNKTIKDREEFLDFFSIWALLKKEVSIFFVAKIIHWPTQKALDYFTRYTKWFNSPNPGKFILYHERFKIFILSKVSLEKLRKTNQKIVAYLEESILKRAMIDSVDYIEFYVDHMLIESAFSQSSEKIIKEIKSGLFIEFQHLVSKDHLWSIRSLLTAILAAKIHDHKKIIALHLYLLHLRKKQKRDTLNLFQMSQPSELDLILSKLDSVTSVDLQNLKDQEYVFLIFIYLIHDILNSDLVKSEKKAYLTRVIQKFEQVLIQFENFAQWHRFFPAYYVFQLYSELKNLDLSLDFLLNKLNAPYFQDYWLKRVSLFPDSNALADLYLFISKLVSLNKSYENLISLVGELFLRKNQEDQFFDLHINKLTCQSEKDLLISHLNQVKMFQNFPEDEDVKTILLTGLNLNKNDGYVFDLYPSGFSSTTKEDLLEELRAKYYNAISSEYVSEDRITDSSISNNSDRVERVFDVGFVIDHLKEFFRLSELGMTGLEVDDSFNEQIMSELKNENHEACINLIRTSPFVYKQEILNSLIQSIISNFGSNVYKVFSSHFNDQITVFLRSEFIKRLDCCLISGDYFQDLLLQPGLTPTDLECIFSLHREYLKSKAASESINDIDLSTIYFL